jgi:hypothetical protein
MSTLRLRILPAGGEAGCNNRLLLLPQPFKVFRLISLPGQKPAVEAALLAPDQRRLLRAQRGTLRWKTMISCCLGVVRLRLLEALLRLAR